MRCLIPAVLLISLLALGCGSTDASLESSGGGADASDAVMDAADAGDTLEAGQTTETNEAADDAIIDVASEVSIEGGSGGDADADATSDDAEAGDDALDCNALSAEIAAQTQVIGSTSVVVRLDYTSLKVLGQVAVKGGYAGGMKEQVARDVAQKDTGYGGGTLLSGPDPEDEWVFFTSAGDFGGSAAVSARTGLTVFGGSTVWAGKGDINYPKDWNLIDLGSGCPPRERRPARGFDLGQGQPLAQAKVDAAVDVVWQTALPAALMQWGYVFDVLVLLYPRSVGAFDPATAEYVVIVNAGWLE